MWSPCWGSSGSTWPNNDLICVCYTLLASLPTCLWSPSFLKETTLIKSSELGGRASLLSFPNSVFSAPRRPPNRVSSIKCVGGKKAEKPAERCSPGLSRPLFCSPQLAWCFPHPASKRGSSHNRPRRPDVPVHCWERKLAQGHWSGESRDQKPSITAWAWGSLL